MKKKKKRLKELKWFLLESRKWRAGLCEVFFITGLIEPFDSSRVIYIT